MMRLLKPLLVGLMALLIIIGGLALWKREEITRLMAVNSLFEADRIVSNFSHMGDLFLTRPIDRGDGPVSALPQGVPYRLSDAVKRWVDARHITSLLIMQHGAIRFEDYYRQTGQNDRRISWSIAKSFLSALTGVLLAQGAIESIDVPVTRYAPSLAGSAYDGATLKDVLQMSSGVVFNEDYLDYNSDINKMGRTIALGGSLDEFAAGLTEADNEPGRQWRYVSIDTHVIGMVLRGATGRSIPALMGEKIIAPLGFDSEPYYIVDGDGSAFVLGGLNMTTRDYARFGQMILQRGRYQGQQVVPAQWVIESTRPSANTPPDYFGYGYQWWVPPQPAAGEVMARGVYGQHIYIDPGSRVVIVSTAADRDFLEPGVAERNVAIYRMIRDDLTNQGDNSA